MSRSYDSMSMTARSPAPFLATQTGYRFSRHHAGTSSYPLRSVELEMILGMIYLYSSYI